MPLDRQGDIPLVIRDCAGIELADLVRARHHNVVHDEPLKKDRVGLQSMLVTAGFDLGDIAELCRDDGAAGPYESPVALKEMNVAESAENGFGVSEEASRGEAGWRVGSRIQRGNPLPNSEK
ncbi:hypothetical protein BGZ98_005033 [Dissophora globulifera]|nr:hypothetical protein BGZ98_005033 [Dissophora globulifera]